MDPVIRPRFSLDSGVGRVAAIEFRPAFQGWHHGPKYRRVAQRRLNSPVADATDPLLDASIRALKGQAKIIAAATRPKFLI